MPNTSYPFPSIPPMFGGITASNPNVGSDFFQPFATDNAIYLQAIRFTLDTDVNVASRNVKIFAGIGVTERYGIAANNVQSASSTFKYNFINGLGAPYLVSGTQEIFIPLPNLFIIHENESLEIHVDNMQAGDQISFIRFSVGQYVQQVNA